MTTNPLSPAIAGGAPSNHARPNAAAAEKAKVSFASELSGASSGRVPPSRAARAALEGRPDLADRPFGSIVSLFARGLDLPAPEAEQPEPPAEPDPAPVPSASEPSPDAPPTDAA